MEKQRNKLLCENNGAPVGRLLQQEKALLQGGAAERLRPVWENCVVDRRVSSLCSVLPNTSHTPTSQHGPILVL